MESRIKPSLIFITGNAGTGKTTLLKHLTGQLEIEPDPDNHEFLQACESIRDGEKIIVAPTGVAAINAGGTTLHSFFQINPFKKYDVATMTTSSIYSDFKYRKEKKELINEIDVLIIDEISMVKAEMLDLIDLLRKTFRANHGQPFGGLQVVVFGDLFQLPPVKAKPSDINPTYRTEFFFSSKVFHKCYFEDNFKYIELKKIYRQKSDVFISILNNIRDGSIEETQLQELNARCLTPQSDEGFITLSTHNINADKINQSKYSNVSGEEKIFSANVFGEFKDDFFRNIVTVSVKIGAQVMVIKNNHSRGYYNGMIGTVKEINENNVIIESKGLDIKIEKEKWEKGDYYFDEMSDSVKFKVTGRFEQIPLKSAWAITIHKSQGLTFDNVIADVDASFDSGQVYVALSRCTSLEGLYLKNPIPMSAIMIDQDVVNFTNYVKNRITI